MNTLHRFKVTHFYEKIFMFSAMIFITRQLRFAKEVINEFWLLTSLASDTIFSVFCL